MQSAHRDLGTGDRDVCPDQRGLAAGLRLKVQLDGSESVGDILETDDDSGVLLTAVVAA